MNITPVNSVSFGKVFLNDDMNTKAVVSTFVKDKNTLESFNKTLEKLDSVTEGYSMMLSGKKDKHAYEFSLNNYKNPKQKCSVAISYSCMNPLHERRKSFSKAMDHLITGCENLINTIKTSVGEKEIDQLFNSRKIHK